MDTKKLRQKILDLAIRGKLVPQDPNDEPASVLLERIRAEKEQLIKEGKIKRSKKSAATDKSHYENVPFEIPKNWVWSKLDDLAFYKKGPFGSSLTKSMFIPDNGNAYKVYEQKNAIQKDSNLGHYFISSEKFQELKGFEVLPNDIIVSCAGTIGETYIMPSDIRSGIINQALMIIRLHNIDITPFYLLYFDFILKNEAGKDGKGTAIKNIPPFDILKNYWIPLPPLAEQDRIIKEVDLWQCLIDSIDGNIEDIFKLSKKTKSKILDLAISGKLVPQDPNDESATELLKRINPDFQPCDNSHYENIEFDIPQNWVWATIGDVFEHNTGKALNASNPNGTMLDYITTSNLYWDRFELSIIKQMPFTESEIERCIVRKGDLLICEGGDVGRAAIWDYDYNIMIQNHIHRLRGKVDICTRYFFYLFMHYKLHNLIGGKGVAIQGLSSRDLHNLIIPVPSLKEQYDIASSIDLYFSKLDMITAEL